MAVTMKQVVNYNPVVDALGIALNNFRRDYIPAILSFITPANIPGWKFVPYRPDGNYPDDELGLSGDFYIKEIARPRKQSSQYELRCVFASGASDMVIGKFSDALTAALLSFCYGVRTSKLFYLDRQVDHKVPYLWDIARLHRLSVFNPDYSNRFSSSVGITGNIGVNFRNGFYNKERIVDTIDVVRKYPSIVVAGASHISVYAMLSDRELGYENPAQGSNWVSILDKYFNYTINCIGRDEYGNDAVQQALNCFNDIMDT